MAITLNLEEKCYLIALFGDVPEHHRARLFRLGTFPAQAGPLVMQEGYRFVAEIEEMEKDQPKKRRKRIVDLMN